MSIIFTEISTLCVALILAIYFQMREEGKKSKDCQLFSRLLLATVSIFVIDTIGWVIDGYPILGQVWITTVIDGLDLINTTLVCWCWVQYALYIARGEKQISKKWYKNITTCLMLLQIVLVCSSQMFHFYYSVDSSGVYHRERGYIVHFLISFTMLFYSSMSNLKAYWGEDNQEKKRELLFVAFIIFIPIFGNIFQLFVYGYPTVWLCMGFMIFVVYVHIQNKRVNIEREKQNSELRQALEEAQIANLAKSDFLSRMSHDMRTPMNAILGIANLLSDRTDPVEIRRDVEQIRQSGEYLLALINDTLDMNKIEAGKMELHTEPINSEDLFDNVIETAKILAMKKGVKLSYKAIDTNNGESVPIIADASRVEQIFMNLITNAVKFTPLGGSVKICMDRIELTSEKVTDRYVVEDTGIGMSKEFLSHVFEAFAQEGRANTDHESGTGLGLTIVKRIVDMMGGYINIESELNKGTKITVVITYLRYKGRLDKRNQQKVELSVLKGKRVLLCEDHPINAQIAIRLLEKQGVIVEQAENGQIGVDMFKGSKKGYYAAILMDIRMPIKNGLEATEMIRKIENRPEAQKIPIIAMTANAFEEDIKQCTKAGMNAHLGKPVEPNKLYTELAKQISK